MIIQKKIIIFAFKNVNIVNGNGGKDYKHIL